MPDQRPAQCAGVTGHGNLRCRIGMQQTDNLIGQCRIILKPDAEGIAGLIMQAGIPCGNFNMPHIFQGIAAGNFLINGERCRQRCLFAVTVFSNSGRRNGRLLRVSRRNSPRFQHLCQCISPCRSRRLIVHIGIGSRQKCRCTRRRQLSIKINSRLTKLLI